MRGKRSIKITKVGYIFMLITLGIGVAALNSGNNLLYLLFGMMLSFILISGILSDTSMRRIDVVRNSPKEVTANSEFPVKLSVKNKKKWLPSFSISVEDVGEHRGGTLGFVPKVAAGQSHDAFYSSLFSSRGIKKYFGFKILTKYPFGLIQKTDYIKREEDVLVYPEIFDLKEVLAASTFFHGEYLSGEKGVGVNPWGLRNYHYGDDARLIHWKSTAKKGEWMVKEFESEKKLRIIIDLVLLAPKYTDGKGFGMLKRYGDLEKLISVAASMVVHLSNNNFEVELTINGKAVPSLGRGYVSGYLRELALLDLDSMTVGQIGALSPINGQGMHLLITNLPKEKIGPVAATASLVINDKNWFDMLSIGQDGGSA